MTYLFFHKMIRNDEHCPNCKRYYISFYDTLEDAYIRAKDEIVEDTDVDLILLKEGYSVWVDEWVRRRNGDKYQIVKIKPNEIYDLCEDLSNGFDINHSEMKFMVLRIDVNKSYACPNNIEFHISFYESIDKAYDEIIEMINILNYDGDEETEKNQLNDDEKLQLKDLKSIWKNNPDYYAEKGNGHHYQIINMKIEKNIYLNGECSQIQPENW